MSKLGAKSKQKRKKTKKQSLSIQTYQAIQYTTVQYINTQWLKGRRSQILAETIFHELVTKWQLDALSTAANLRLFKRVFVYHSKLPPYASMLHSRCCCSLRSFHIAPPFTSACTYDFSNNQFLCKHFYPAGLLKDVSWC